MITRNRWTLFVIWFLTALGVFVFHYHYFVSYFTSPIFPGLDTIGHVEIGKYYAEHIFPRVWGWAPDWFGGMPFPQFYPPLFYFVVAGLKSISSFSYELVFKIFTFIVALSIPGLLVLVATRFKVRTSALWLTGIVGGLLVVTPFGRYDNLGVSLSSTFTVGLVTHALAFDLLLLWLWAFLGSAESRRAYYLSIIFLALTALSSVHVVPIAGIIYLASIVVDREVRKNWVSLVFLPGLIAIGLTSFWLIPFLSTYSYMPSLSLGLANGIGAKTIWPLITTWWPTGLCLLAAGALAFLHRNKKVGILVFSTVLVFVLVAFPFENIFKTLPVHTYRLLPFVYFSGAIFVGYVYDIFAERFKKSIRFMIFSVLVVLFLLPTIPYLYRGITGVYYYRYQEERALDIADYLKDKQGMFAVEATDTGRFLSYLIEEKAEPGLRSNYTVFAESSISSLFQVPFRTSLSDKGREKIAVESKLAHDESFTRPQNIVDEVAHARALGITYLVVKSPKIKTLFRTSSALVLEKDFGTWQVFRVAGEKITDAFVPAFEPVLLFAPLGLKDARQGSLTYLSLAQDAFHYHALDITLVKSNDLYLDTSRDLFRFDTTVVSQYVYHSEVNAVANLTNFAKNKKLILIESPDPLYIELHTALQDNAHVTFLPPDSEKLFSILENKKIPTKQVALSLVMTPTEIEVTASSTSQENIPVLIRSSYFPAWKRTDGQPVYLASPTSVFTFVTTKADIVFTTPAYVYIGYCISLLSAGALVFMIRSNRRYNYRHLS